MQPIRRQVDKMDHARDRHRAGRGGRGRGGRGTYRGGRERRREDRGEGMWRGFERGDARGADQAQGDSANWTRTVKPLGYKTIESLLDKDPDEAAVQLSSLKKGLEKLLHVDDIRYDVVALLFQVLNHVLQAHGAAQTINMLIDMLGRSPFLTKHLPRHLIAMRTERDKNRIRKIPRCIQDIAKVLCEIHQRRPTYRSDLSVSSTLLEDVIGYTEQKGIIVDDEIRRDVNVLKEFQATIDKEREDRARGPVEPSEPPPDDFRDISVLPKSEELTDLSVRPYLRANIEKGEYKDADHYLDVQFRLLREDFIHPLREGIREYKKETLRPGKRSKRLQDIRLYHDVTLEEPVYTQTGVMFRMHFDESRLKGIRWQASKRLIFGSLVILTPDDFKTLIFGTIANRSPQDLEKGLVDIKLERDEEIVEIFSDKTFVMAESSAYFEAYRHVLKGLQSVTEETLPLPDYILSVSSTVGPPAYIGQDRTTEYDLSPLVSDSIPNANAIKRRLKASKILDNRDWQRVVNTGLDESQLQAVKAALTQEMAVIQGPPGTGKTYIGLKIVHTLLENKSIWIEQQLLERSRSNRPILLVCYTNHALDQFLEGVAEYNCEGIVRVGGRSSSEALKRFNLNSLRSSKLREEMPRHVRRRIGEVRGEIECLGREIKSSQDKMNAAKKGLLHERVLLPYMDERHYRSLTFGNFSQGYGASRLVDWLLFDMNLNFGNDQLPGRGGEPLGDEAEPIDAEMADEDDEGDFNILEEADILEEMRILDIDDPQPNVTLSDTDNEDDSLAFHLNDLDNIHQADGWQFDRRTQRQRKQELQRNLRGTEKMTDDEARRITNVWNILESRNRWRLYRYWIHRYRRESQRMLIHRQREFSDLCQELREARNQEDFEILRHATVIGMTTTGAARCHTLLQRIKPRIVIVEEAAEVLEAHIITALTESCQHLVLIGDHQQLRPNPTVYKLAREYHLDISLFERMIKNEFPCQRLNLQHRMRPEISRLMKLDKLYPNLEDHESVEHLEDIEGVTKNIFFIHHEEAEDSNDETRSHANIHEAKFMMALCRYLLQQGYLPEQITILTTYTGQLFNFKRETSRSDFKGVRVATVDNFQGEENDIILLSLVRSNTEGSAGFLTTENRICVALSRAKKGLYCIGNFKLLAEQCKQGRGLWTDIVKCLQMTGSIGKALQLQCKNHPQTRTQVASSKDFENVPEGGCTLPCEARLKCGHMCRMPCHPTDRKHENYKCMQPCTKIICRAGHRCSQRCFNKCDKMCTQKDLRKLPCGHMQLVMCYQHSADVTCEHPCPLKLQCGHSCKSSCGKTCTVACEELVIRSSWPCKHRVRAKCSAGPESCPESCNALLNCGHICSGTCGSCYRGRLHVMCRQKCDRTLVCGHPCKETCATNCPPCGRTCQNRCIHSRCRKRCGEPCVPCAEICPWRCKHFQCRKKCGEPCDRRPCMYPCDKMLKCNHPCIGVCGEPCPKLCRICNKDEVTEIFFGDEDEPHARFVELEDCGHVIEVKGLDKWMTQASDTAGDAVSIQLKGCPRCKTPVRRNLRYGNAIKQALNDVEAVKRKTFGDKQHIEFTREQLERDLTSETEVMSMSAIAKEQKLFPRKEDARHFLKCVDETSSLSWDQVNSVKNRVVVLKELREIGQKLRSLHLPGEEKELAAALRADLAAMKVWLCRGEITRMSPQQVSDANSEATRNRFALHLLTLVTTKPSVRTKAAEEVKKVKYVLLAGTNLTEEELEEIKKLLKIIATKSDGLGITEAERKEIVSAIGLTKGHWFKCPQGHVYAIGDCGGATVESTCPECGSTIGGRSHALREDNSLAPEMDGARHAAWSEQANMENFDLRDLM
ncbi:NFX1-type zinc finger-containing protein 1-like [Diadema antillarum]|uniref:NFX1-type zinc finger-containing protein 1-like n=1 Tax=Diadema antillarum TaxID=105358 RepID=UPI003A87C955